MREKAHIQMHHGPGRGHVEACSALLACPVFVQKGLYGTVSPDDKVTTAYGKSMHTKWLRAGRVRC